MADYALQIQESLRVNGYPDYRQMNFTEVLIKNDEQPQPEAQTLKRTSWNFINSAGTEGYILQPDSLVFHTTLYDTFKDFLKKMSIGLEFVHSAVTLAYTDRIGIRYLNAISSNENDKLSDYLNESLLGFSTSSKGVLKHSFIEAVTEINAGTLVTRALMIENGIALPPDLFPLQLHLQPKFASLKSKTAVLDIDYYMTQRLEFDIKLINEKLLTFHDVVTEVFQELMTSHAKKTWG